MTSKLKSRVDADRFLQLGILTVAVTSIVSGFLIIAMLFVAGNRLETPASYSGEFAVVDKRDGGKTGTEFHTCHQDGSNCRWIDVNAATYVVYPVGSTVEVEEGTVLLPDHVRP